MSGTAGAWVLYRSCLALLDAPPPGLPSAFPGKVRHNTMSNRAQVARNAALDRVAGWSVALAQRGFIPGRGMRENVCEALAPMRSVARTVGSVLGVVLFDIKVAFPGLSWQWIWRALRVISAPLWLIVAIRLMCEGSYSEIVFYGELTDYGFPVILRG